MSNTKHTQMTLPTPELVMDLDCRIVQGRIRIDLMADAALIRELIADWLLAEERKCVAALTERMRPYLEHAGNCSGWLKNGGSGCTCGLEALLKELE